jgi:hypothetical protein
MNSHVSPPFSERQIPSSRAASSMPEMIVQGLRSPRHIEA